MMGETVGAPCAPVHKMIPFSAVDGQGNRTAIFLQGCNINCKYCHNPETRALCNHCGACIASCPVGALAWANEKPLQAQPQKQVVFNPASCIQCDACINTCAYGASPKVAWQTAAQVFAQVQRQMPFIRGVTVSGGECMLYPAFVQDLFTLCKGVGLGTLIDSNGTIPFAEYPSLMAVTDGVMLDVKAFTHTDALAVTGADNATVLQNALYLAQQGKLTELRTVVVPDLCDAAQVITNLASYLETQVPLSTLCYKLIAYRPFGVRAEYRNLQTPTETQMQALASLAQRLGFGKVVLL